MQSVIVIMMTAALLVQAQTPAKRMSDAQMDGLKAGARTVRTSIERSPGVLEPVDESAYDDQGRLVSRTVYDRGQVLSTSTYEHVEGGVRIEARTYAVRPPVTRLEPKGGRVPKRYFDETGAELFSRTIDYDSLGRPLAEFTYTGKVPKTYLPVARVVYQYARGKPSTVTYFERVPEVQVRRLVFAFDRQGVWNETIVYEPNQPSPEKWSWTDTLDPLGNWTRRIDRRLRAGKETVLTFVRTYTY